MKHTKTVIIISTGFPRFARNNSKKYIITMLLFLFGSYTNFIQSMKSDTSKNPTDSSTTISDLPKELHNIIFSMFAPETFQNSEQIVEAVKNSISLMLTNKYFLGFKDQVLQQLAEIIKQKASPGLLLSTLKSALAKKDYTTATVLLMAGADSAVDRKLNILGDLIQKNKQENILGHLIIQKLADDFYNEISPYFIALSRAIEAGYDPADSLLVPTGIKVTLNKRTYDDVPPLIAALSFDAPQVAKKIIIFAAHYPELFDMLIRTNSPYQESETILNIMISNLFLNALNPNAKDTPIRFDLIATLLRAASNDTELLNYLLETPDKNGDIPLIRLINKWAEKENNYLINALELLYNYGEKSGSNQLDIADKKGKTAQQLLDKHKIDFQRYDQPETSKTKPGCKKYNKDGQCVLF
jgi:hypothetical protein